MCVYMYIKTCSRIKELRDRDRNVWMYGIYCSFGVSLSFGMSCRILWSGVMTNFENPSWYRVQILHIVISGGTVD